MILEATLTSWSMQQNVKQRLLGIFPIFPCKTGVVQKHTTKAQTMIGLNQMKQTRAQT